MAGPTLPTVPAPVFNDNAVPHGSRYELFNSGTIQAGASINYYLLESIRISRITKRVERPDPIGGPNGFVLIKGQDTMTAKAQVAATNTATLKRGNWFTDDFDPSTGTFVPGLPETASGALEYWVIETSSDVYEAGQYLYQDITLLKANFPLVD